MAPDHRPAILVIAPQPFFQWRGAAIRVRHTVQVLAELGFRVDLLTLPFGQDLAVPGVRILRVKNPLPFVRNVPIGPSFRKLFFDLVLLFKALGLVRKHRYAALHCLEEASFIGALLRKPSHHRFIFDKLGDLDSYRKGLLRNGFLRLYRRLERFPLRRADAVLVGCPLLLQQTREIVPDQDIRHLFDLPTSLNEASPEDSARLRHHWLEGSAGTVALYVGSFAVYQGIDLLFESMPIALESRPDLTFVVIGGSPSEIAQRENWLIERGIRQSVLFLGRVHPERIPAHLKAADLLLCPRLSGVNAPLKLLDYMRAERAIVATDQEGNRTILDHDSAILTPKIPQAFARGILTASGDAPLRSRLAQHARRHLDQSFSYAEFKARLRDCYRSVLGDSEPSAREQLAPLASAADLRDSTICERSHQGL